jgi:ABC-type uncharacterized transport system permease subunit
VTHVPPPPSHEGGGGTRGRGGVRLERRSRVARAGRYRAGGVVAGAAIAILALPLITGTAPGTVYSSLGSGLSGSLGIQSVITGAIPLVLAGLAVALPYRLGLWNVGVDGQMLTGAWVSAAIGFSLPNAPSVLLVALMLIGAMVGGAVWALGPALARAYLGVNEIITTFLLNFVAVAWLAYWANGPWKGTASVGGTVSRSLPDQATLGTLRLGSIAVQGGVVIALVAPVLVWAAFRFSRTGYEWLVVGSNPRAGVYAGMPVKRRLVGAMLVGGAIGGLAGTVEMVGDLHLYTDGITNNTGFAALVVAVLAGGREAAVVLVAVFYAILIVAGQQLSSQGISNDIVLMIVGFTLLTGALGDAAARFRLVRRRSPEPAEVAA